MPKYKTAAEVKVGVIGYGGAFNMGRHHLNEMKTAGMTPTAVMELDPKRLEAAAKDWPGIETYSDLKTMLKKSKVDLLTIITPHNTHAKIATECLKAGRHVVCEKPMAITTAECDAMIAAAKKSGAVLSTYHNRHWDGLVLEALEHIRAGKIGKVVRIDTQMGGFGKPGDWWRSSKSISGGILYDWGVHVLEYILQIVNSDILEVSGFAWNGVWANQTAWKKDTNEDDAYFTVRFANGSWATMSQTAIDSKPCPWWLKITGTEGTYLCHNNNTYELIKHDNAGHTVSVTGHWRRDEWQNYYNNVAAHLVKGEKLVITGEWARRPIHIIDLAVASAKKGTALRAKYR